MALHELKETRGLVIKEADKGGAVVVMTKVQYKSEAIRQLSDHDAYHPLSFNPTIAFQLTLSKHLQMGKEMGFLSVKTVKYLFVDKPVVPVFHHLPKIHKSDRAIRL